MKLRILKFKEPLSVFCGEIVTEKIEFPIEWAGQSADSPFQAYAFRGNRVVIDDDNIFLNGEKLSLVKAWEIVP